MGTLACTNMNEMETQNRLIVRYRQGMPIYIMPDLPNKLKEAVLHIKAGGSLTDLVKPINDGSGRGPHQESTWFQLIYEILSVSEQPPEGKVDREKAVLCVLEAISSNEKDTEIWLAAKEEIFKYIDILSLWNYSPLHLSYQNEHITKKEGKYYVYLSGQVCEIIGKRTEKEDRWDYIADKCISNCGAIYSLFKLIALVNICLDFQRDPKHYPESMNINLPESIDGRTGFLHWEWYVKWPYRPKIINWRPNNNLCDPNWLVSDFLSYFSNKEGITEKELEPAEWKWPDEKWREEFEKYPGQLEFAIDTQLRFGDVDETWFDFRGKKLRWINQTENRHAVLIIPVSDRKNYNEECELAMRFLSHLAFNTDIPINVIMYVECQTRFPPMLCQPKRIGGIVYPSNYNNYIKNSESFSNKKDLAYALYKEGLSSSSVYYSFLSFYKIIELCEEGSKITTWINGNLDKILYPGALERIEEIKKENNNVAHYLYKSCRCAIAHIKENPKVDPDKPEDILRLTMDRPIVKGLARYVIESGVFNLPEKEIKS